MKKCKECKSENIKEGSFGDGIEFKCKDCGLIARRVLVGNRLGKWFYSKERVEVKGICRRCKKFADKHYGEELFCYGDPKSQGKFTSYK